MQNWAIKFRILIWSVFFLVLGWILYMGIVPGGKISYFYDFSKPNFFIGNIRPLERVAKVLCNFSKDGIKECAQKIVADPVYFNLKTLRNFDRAKVTLTYKKQEDAATGDENKSSIIEAGIMADGVNKNYRIKPLDNEVINDVSKKWEVTKENGLILLQRKKKYNSVDEFLENLPDQERIAVYNYDLKTEYLLPGYKAQLARQVIDSSIRGPYQFYVYLKNETLDLSFSFLDINKDRSSENVDIFLYYQGQVIGSKHLNGDSNKEDDSKITDLGKLDFRVPDLPEGVYKIEVRTTDDIVTKEISATQNKLVFINKLWILGESVNSDKPLDVPGNMGSLFTSSKKIFIKTTNPASLQTLKIGKDDLKIEETYKQYTGKTNDKISEMKFEKSGLMIAGDGVFAFKKGQFFNPQINKVNNELDVDRDDIDYIIARYEMPKIEGEWKVANAEFELGSAYKEKGNYSIMISIPGLVADDDMDDGVVVKEIRVDLEGKPIVEKIKNILSYSN